MPNESGAEGSQEGHGGQGALTQIHGIDNHAGKWSKSGRRPRKHSHSAKFLIVPVDARPPEPQPPLINAQHAGGPRISSFTVWPFSYTSGGPWR